MLGSPNWIGRVEYLHYDLGQTATSSTSIQAGGARDVSTALGLDSSVTDADLRAMSKNGRTAHAGRSERLHPSGAVQYVRLWVTVGRPAPVVPVVPGPLVAPHTREPHPLHAVQRRVLRVARRWYLAGPITGLPDLNYPVFHAEAARLRALGYEVVNPAEINVGATDGWSACMRRDIAQLVTCTMASRGCSILGSGTSSQRIFLGLCQHSAFIGESFSLPASKR